VEPAQLPTPESTPVQDGPTVVPDGSTTTSTTAISSESQPVSQDGPRMVGLDLDERNIVEGKRIRRPAPSRDAYFGHLTRKQEYQESLEHLEELSGFYTAFTAGRMHNRTVFHRTELPEPPKFWKDLATHPHQAGFRAAANKEYRDLERRGTFKPVPELEAGKAFIIPTMWVFTYKFDSNGNLVKYKARLVVRGDLQKDSRFQDNYAATLAARIFRALMAIAAYFDLEMRQYDAVNAFTNSGIDEDVFIRFPEGFEWLGMCLKLLRALYGLRRSPLLWFKEFSTKLQALGMKQSPECQCLFFNSKLILFFYVDDIVILYHRKDTQEHEQFRAKLLDAYEIREMGELQWFLGIRIIRDRLRRKIWLCQDSYIESLMKSFKLQSGKYPNTPMLTDELRPYSGQAAPQEIYAYQRKVGSVGYAATITRPDIARTFQKLAEFLTNPGPEHHATADRTIQYLYGTRTLALEYGVTDQEQTPGTPLFTSSSDASFADDATTRKSTEGYLFQLFGGPIDWRCIKQKTVTTSTTEAELMALSHAAKELLWWERFFQGIQLDLDQDYSINCDNLQTVGLILKETPRLVTKLKHVDIHHHWLRQEVAHQKLQIQWISTKEMPADGLTKALPRQKHETFVQQLKLVDIGRILSQLSTASF
jgi:hypothetical protein